MEMVIVEINVPAISTSFDFRIPTGSTVAEVTQEIVRIFEQTQNNIKFDTDVLVLFDTVSHKVMSPGKYIAELGIKDGSRLMLL